MVPDTTQAGTTPTPQISVCFFGDGATARGTTHECMNMAAMVSDKGFDFLDAPVKTVTGAHVPVPYSRVLETLYVPTPDRVAVAARDLM